ncbi:MAG TPA: flagellar biosynthesis anti-sigma factor FlgM [Bryobacteraceae bacterium]|jgi:anti-sigma28 factor (negative regulator of flagellin synthesis)|nr:flagellar biosynthesis anti-sigma factor FlgM [Bryobacteraceae bacterium]
MRISNTYSYVNQTSLQTGISQKEKNMTQSAGSSSESDSVRGVFAKAAAQRATKIAQLQSQIQSGAYQIDDQAVSRQIIGSHLDSPPLVD